MSKKKINVIDLDQTLISYDSYSIYLRRPLYNFFYILPGILLIIFRKLRLISLSAQKKYSVVLNQRISGYHKYIKEFSDRLFLDIDDRVIKMVAEESDNVTINILCTASPYDYAGLLAAKLDWECIASHFSDNDNIFFHVHGNNKIRILDKLYPNNKYDYNFALSDSEGDLKLLALFKKSVLYKNNA